MEAIKYKMARVTELVQMFLLCLTLSLQRLVLIGIIKL